MNKVWVIAGNDYPAAVRSTQEKADDFVEAKRKEHATNLDPLKGSGIYWRAYEFEVDGDEQ